MIIAVDFDGTIVEHSYPKIGKPVPNAIKSLKRLIKNRNKIVLYTCREDHPLKEAEHYLLNQGIQLYGVNCLKYQSSRKLYFDYLIDDRSIGVPLIYPEEGKPYVNWNEVMKYFSDSNIEEAKIKNLLKVESN